MDISDVNFDSMMPRIEEAIETCDIISFDCEFSGLNDIISPVRDQDCSFEEVYERIKTKVGDFEIIQFGLTTYHQDPTNHNYSAKCFNFYVFPDDNFSNSTKLFSMHPSAIKFLSDQNFNFNKVFCEGITYLSRKDESELRNSESTSSKSPTDEAVSLKKTMTPEEIDKQVGFRKVIDLIIKANKPIIGHNCIIDLCHILKQFITNSLPETHIEFFSQVHELFPKIYDTKYLYDSAFDFKIPSIHESSLSSLNKLLSEPEFKSPEISLHHEYPKYYGSGSSVSYHEAGYDSYITGNVFLKFVSRIAREEGICDPAWPQLSQLESISHHENKMEPGRGNVIAINSFS